MQDEKGRYTFRSWNPKKIDTPWGESNESEVDTSCPMVPCCCCYAVELGMKKFFKEEIDRVDIHAGCGPNEMMNEY